MKTAALIFNAALFAMNLTFYLEGTESHITVAALGFHAGAFLYGLSWSN